MELDFKTVNGHIEAYNCGGDFCFSADTMQEALEELVLFAA